MSELEQPVISNSKRLTVLSRAALVHFSHVACLEQRSLAGGGAAPDAKRIAASSKQLASVDDIVEAKKGCIFYVTFTPAAVQVATLVLHNIFELIKHVEIPSGAQQLGALSTLEIKEAEVLRFVLDVSGAFRERLFGELASRDFGHFDYFLKLVAESVGKKRSALRADALVSEIIIFLKAVAFMAGSMACESGGYSVGDKDLMGLLSFMQSYSVAGVPALNLIRAQHKSLTKIVPKAITKPTKTTNSKPLNVKFVASKDGSKCIDFSSVPAFSFGAAPANKPADAPADKPADKPAGKPADKPADEPADESDNPADENTGISYDDLLGDLI